MAGPHVLHDADQADAGVRQQGFQAAPEDAAVDRPHAGHVERVVDVGVGRKHAPQALVRGRVQARQCEPRTGADVEEHRGLAAGMSHHGEAAALGHALEQAGEELRRGQHFVERADGDQAVTPRHGGEDARVVGEGAGVRCGHALARLRAPGLEHDDGLRSGVRPHHGTHEALGFADAFGEDDDDLRRRVVDEIVDEVGRRDVGLVAGGDQVAELEAPAGTADGTADSAALDGDGDGAGLEADGERGGVTADPAVDVDVADGVGADEADAVAAGGFEESFLEAGAVGAGFPESAGDDDRGARAACRRLFEQVRHLLAADGEDHAIDRAPDGVQRGGARVAVDAVVAGIDRIDGPGKTAVTQRPHHLAAVARPFRGADHGDGARREQRREVTHPGRRVRGTARPGLRGRPGTRASPGSRGSAAIRERRWCGRWRRCWRCT